MLKALTRAKTVDKRNASTNCSHRTRKSLSLPNYQRKGRRFPEL